jgi:hypothetical protein
LLPFLFHLSVRYQSHASRDRSPSHPGHVRVRRETRRRRRCQNIGARRSPSHTVQGLVPRPRYARRTAPNVQGAHRLPQRGPSLIGRSTDFSRGLLCETQIGRRASPSSFTAPPSHPASACNRLRRFGTPRRHGRDSANSLRRGNRATP